MNPDNLPGMFGGESIWTYGFSWCVGLATCRALGLAEAEPVAP
jgi:hypothetical protein